MTLLEAVLDTIEASEGAAEPLPATDGWRLVLRENVAYLADDAARDRCMAALEKRLGVDPAAVLDAPDDVLLSIVAGMRPVERVARLRKCAELRLADAPWRSFPGIGKPGAERIALFSGEQAVLALDSNATRALYRLGFGELGRSYGTTYRSVQAAAAAQLTPDVRVLQRAHQLLRRHGQTICRRTPACERCPVFAACAAAQGLRTLSDPFA